MSVAQATVTQTVSHVPVKPKYGFSEPNPNMALNGCAGISASSSEMSSRYVRRAKDSLDYLNTSLGQ